MMECDERAQLISKLTRIMLALQSDIQHCQHVHAQEVLSLEHTIKEKDEQIQALKEQLEVHRKHKTDVNTFESPCSS